MDVITAMLVLPKDDLWGAEALRSALSRSGIRVLPEAAFVAKPASAARRPQIILAQLTGDLEQDVSICRRLSNSGLAPVIAISADTDDRNLLAVFEAGVADYVTRPIRTRVLAMRIRIILRRVPGRTVQTPSAGDGRAQIHSAQPRPAATEHLARIRSAIHRRLAGLYGHLRRRRAIKPRG